jgi:hypothetical protein
MHVRICREICIGYDLTAIVIFWSNARSQTGWTVLMYAARGGHADCVRLLLDAGVDKSAVTIVRVRSAASVAGRLCTVWREE